MTLYLRRGALAAALLFGLTACHSGNDAAAAAAAAKPAPKQVATHSVPSDLGELRVTEVASGLEHPWAVALLPDGGFLVTERAGRLRRVGADGAISAPLKNVPEVWAQGQGGLLDVVLAPDFASSQRIYLSYAEPGPDGSAGTAVATATLGADALGEVKRIYQQQPKLVGPNHFGSRIAFDGKGHVFITQGERQQRMASQELDKLQGKLVRLNLDGSVPADNPFVGRSDARAEIWSYGHRNMQSLAVDPRTGTVWEAEHGPRGGDEINLPQPGKNYGWPIVTHGIDYSGLKIAEAEGKEKPGMEPPYHVWEKSPALSGMAFYTGHAGSAWNDSLFLGALSDGSLIRLSLDGDRIVDEERLLKPLGWRIRDVRVSADGKVYALTDESEGKLLRIEPPKAK
ncbi:Glucose/arabinose dehydrogenase, beta-propeller fold [Lysobacter sp. yr284]|uniref:PQQ-dependent sugar dehydrogenase n=1 Tax=Lysobacter sp. yr284 TaxID=1761791 RepID=UPI000897E45A|nr:PQQ-dependent sugar dehydrogenase [Lysobacter sp. yr284]SDY24907.1 Glucose/arabinose dehydrogenase, beta-propeller fold [Lysobacter sp. yr284]